MITCEVCESPEHTAHWETLRDELNATRASCRALVDELNELMAERAKLHEAVAVYEGRKRS